MSQDDGNVNITSVAVVERHAMLFERNSLAPGWIRAVFRHILGGSQFCLHPSRLQPDQIRAERERG